jgi:hypothetical protein
MVCGDESVTNASKPRCEKGIFLAQGLLVLNRYRETVEMSGSEFVRDGVSGDGGCA